MTDEFNAYLTNYPPNYTASQVWEHEVDSAVSYWGLNLWNKYKVTWTP